MQRMWVEKIINSDYQHLDFCFLLVFFYPYMWPNFRGGSLYLMIHHMKLADNIQMVKKLHYRLISRAHTFIDLFVRHQIHQTAEGFGLAQWFLTITIRYLGQVHVNTA